MDYPQGDDANGRDEYLPELYTTTACRLFLAHHPEDLACLLRFPQTHAGKRVVKEYARENGMEMAVLERALRVIRESGRVL